jgi:putative zinc finger protein
MSTWLGTRGTTPAADHPDAIATAAYLEGTLSPVARDDFEAHLATCDECRAGVSLLRLDAGRDLEAAPPEMLRRARSLAPPSVHAGSLRRTVLPAGLAAGLVAAAGLALWMGGWVGPRSPRSGLPSSVEREGALPSLQALSPARGETVDAARLAFRWNPVDGADRYVVILLDVGGTEVAALEARLPGGHVPWPADRPLLPAGTYLWSVRALVLDRVLAETRLIPFEIR